MKIAGRIALAGLVLVAATVCVWEFRWLAVVTARKVSGNLPDVEWRELPGIISLNAGVSLHRLAASGNPNAAIEDPFTSATDRARGRVLFGTICAKCHGPGAGGGMGPPLVGRSLTHGDSDWSMYRTITHGVPNTAMQPGFVSRHDAWLVIAYLRELAGSGGSRRTGPSGPMRSAWGLAPEITSRQLQESSSITTGDWVLPGGSYNQQRFSQASEVNTGNVSKLQVQWVHQFPSSDAPNESTAVVAGNYMFVTLPPATVFAFDVKTGAQIWHYTHPMDPGLRLCCLATSRGVSVVGKNVYFGTLDAHVIALDSTTGAVVWDRTVADYKAGYSITSPPLPVGDLVVTGVAGGEFPIRGFINAYDAASGALRWHFNTIPEPGQPGSETWSGEAWKTGGASTWGTGAYDPELGLLYWGVGTSAPDFNAAARPGDNLYSNCEVALDAKTGKLVWHFQFLPGDDHDWDSTQTPTLIDTVEQGASQKQLVVANRGGFFYVLDRTTGRFIRGTPYIKQTWALGLSPSGRPIRAQNSRPSEQGTYVVPSVNGATNWWPSAYNPDKALYYLNAEQGGGLFFLDRASRPKAGALFVSGSTTYVDSFVDSVVAVDPATAKIRWSRRNATVTSEPRGGLLTTAGGLVFGSDGPDLYALDAATGQQLWSFNSGGHISAPPITYRVDGRQFLAVVAGQDLMTFALPEH